MEKMNAKSISFDGMVFMYGEMQIIVEKENDKVILTKLAGADGYASEAEEKDIDSDIFDKLLAVIDTIGCSMIKSEEENTYIAVEEEEGSGAYEWNVSVFDEKDNILFCLNGTQSDSKAFNIVSEALESVCSDFGSIKEFFNGVNE